MVNLTIKIWFFFFFYVLFCFVILLLLILFVSISDEIFTNRVTYGTNRLILYANIFFRNIYLNKHDCHLHVHKHTTIYSIHLIVLVQYIDNICWLEPIVFIMYACNISLGVWLVLISIISFRLVLLMFEYIFFVSWSPIV